MQGRTQHKPKSDVWADLAKESVHPHLHRRFQLLLKFQVVLQTVWLRQLLPVLCTLMKGNPKLGSQVAPVAPVQPWCPQEKQYHQGI